MNLNSLSTFARAYLTCALWSSNDESTPQGGKPFDANYNLSDIHEGILETMAKEADAFAQANRADIQAAGLTDERAGFLFWLNRNGHGSGFWDEYSQGDARHTVCERLSKASEAAGSRDLYLGDDDLIYQA